MGCDANGVRGYPTIKYGDPSNLEDYQGGRDFDALKKFAEENLKPMCSPTNIDLCDDEKKAEIKKFSDMGEEELGNTSKERRRNKKKLSPLSRTKYQNFKLLTKSFPKTRTLRWTKSRSPVLVLPKLSKPLLREAREVMNFNF